MVLYYNMLNFIISAINAHTPWCAQHHWLAVGECVNIVIRAGHANVRPTAHGFT